MQFFPLASRVLQTNYYQIATLFILKRVKVKLNILAILSSN
jgi:hypothetical protein